LKKDSITGWKTGVTPPWEQVIIATSTVVLAQIGHQSAVESPWEQVVIATSTVVLAQIGHQSGVESPWEQVVIATSTVSSPGAAGCQRRIQVSS
ncbi:hypothetical protein, partial [Klebsiella pneumoniae]|uniref:hypothetical protein n=1 Tax=Klebsiella pneumoniae TaxID=573 RepID=UPI00163DBE38